MYHNDRERYTPHIHLKELDDREIEVSLLDWSIVNVKKPKNLDRNWSNFTDFRDKFFEWIPGNEQKLYSLWDYNNPDNTLYDHVQLHHTNITDTLSDYFGNKGKPIDISALKGAFFKRVGKLFSDQENRKSYMQMTLSDLLTTIGVYEEFGLENADKALMNKLDDWFRTAKMMFDY